MLHQLNCDMDNDKSSEEQLENSDPFKPILPEYLEYPDLQLHPHHVLDKDKPDYWHSITSYLQML